MKEKRYRVVMFLVICSFTTIAWCESVLAQQQTDAKPGVSQLVRVLEACRRAGLAKAEVFALPVIPELLSPLLTVVPVPMRTSVWRSCFS